MQNHRNACGDLVRRLMVAIDIHLAEIFPMITAQHNDGFIVYIKLYQEIENPPNIIVSDEHTTVITIKHFARGEHIWCFLGLSGIHRLHRLIGRKTIVLARAMGSAGLPMARSNILGIPSR